MLHKPVEHWDSILVVQTVRKLDSKARMLWELSVASTTDMSKYAELDTFLSGVLRSLETIKEGSWTTDEQ